MMISPETLRELLDYNPETGDLIWRERPLEMFKTERDWNAWNARNAGKKAFTATISRGYKHGTIFKNGVYAPRAAWVIHHGRWPVHNIDHINGDPSDNRIDNLRDVNQHENMRNASIPKHNKSGVIGVHWSKASNKWTAQITSGGRRIHLGVFDSKEDAISARKDAEVKCGYSPNHGREPVSVID